MKPEKVHITEVKVSNTKKDGSECVDKNGKRFLIVGIKTNQYGAEWINCNYFTEANPSDWIETDQELVIYDEEFNGKTSKKFKLPFKGGKGGGKTDSVQSVKGNDEVLAALRLTYAEARAANATAQKCYTLLTDVIRNLSLSGMYKEHTSDGAEEPTF